jgi:hypothetical protein
MRESRGGGTINPASKETMQVGALNAKIINRAAVLAGAHVTKTACFRLLELGRQRLINGQQIFAVTAFGGLLSDLGKMLREM